MFRQIMSSAATRQVVSATVARRAYSAAPAAKDQFQDILLGREADGIEERQAFLYAPVTQQELDNAGEFPPGWGPGQEPGSTFPAPTAPHASNAKIFTVVFGTLILGLTLPIIACEYSKAKNAAST
eukprot:TRINITY_DN11894_c0_g1_i1.p2 TRINITY_DN11894_c0_g1~~TRINITY_DN11894_c0_g1_i1.p2  ORF type:complete len:133 (-),score=21.93 TRINITY_DN11894_c0_g1_i1:94-471(-)